MSCCEDLVKLGLDEVHLAVDLIKGARILVICVVWIVFDFLKVIPDGDRLRRWLRRGFGRRLGVRCWIRSRIGLGLWRRCSFSLRAVCLSVTIEITDASLVIVTSTDGICSLPS